VKGNCFEDCSTKGKKLLKQFAQKKQMPQMDCHNILQMRKDGCAFIKL
jgi:hypothetical protein